MARTFILITVIVIASMLVYNPLPGKRGITRDGEDKSLILRTYIAEQELITHTWSRCLWTSSARDFLGDVLNLNTDVLGL